MSAPRTTAVARLQRLLAILQWAALHEDGVTAQELCDRFRLTQADLVRELSLASMVGADSANYDEMPFEVFIEDDRVYVRLFSFRRPMRMTPAESLALVAAADVLVDRRSEEGRATALARALDKLAATLGIEPGVALDVDHDPDGGPVGRLLRSAIDGDRRVTFVYWSYGRDSVATRRVDPWELFSESGVWYLSGWAHDASAMRNFRLDRMEDVAQAEEHRSSAPPAAGEPSARAVEAAPQVVLELGARGRWVAEAYPVAEATELEDGRLRVTVAVAGRKWLQRLLLQLGPQATVVEMDSELGDRDLVSSAATSVLARYR